MKPLNVLSIDGGGILGIIPAMILAKLEQILQRKTNNPQARIIDFFDFFAGTSTGGIIVALLLAPDPKDLTKPRYDMEDVVKFYSEKGTGIFTSSYIRKVLGGFGLVSDKYDITELERLLKKHFGNTQMSELLKPCLIPAYNLELGSTYFFCSHDHQSGVDTARQFYLRDVCRATSAAPSYFKPASFLSASKVTHACVDGGVFANNPSLCAIAEAGKSDQEYTLKTMTLLSLGTGKLKEVIEANKFTKRIALLNIPQLIKIMMGGVSETTHHIVETMFGNMGSTDNYMRLDPDLPDAKIGAMDNASKENIGRLRALTEVYIEHNIKELEKWADTLLKDDGLERASAGPRFTFTKTKEAE